MEVPEVPGVRRLSVGQVIGIAVALAVLITGGGLGGWIYYDRQQQRQDLNTAVDRLTAVEQRVENAQTDLLNTSSALDIKIQDVKSGVDDLRSVVANINARTPSPVPVNTNSNPTNTDNSVTAFSVVKSVDTLDYIRGTTDAPLTLIEYSDLECPYCKQFHTTMQRVMTDYAGRVRWVYRNFPLSFHQNAEKEAEAALCVGKLGGTNAFWAFVDDIYSRTTSNGTGFALTALGPLAKEVGVDQTKFQSCLDSGEMAATVAAQEADGTSGGVQGTPSTLIVNTSGKTLSGIAGAYTYDQVKAILDQALTSS